MNDEITRSIAHAAQQMHRASGVDEVLEMIVRSAVETLPAFDHIGVSTVEKRGHIVNRAANSSLVLELDQLQYGIPEGPCVDSLDGEDVIAAPEIKHDQRWPQYVPQAVKLGLLAQLAVRLHLADQGTTGGLNLYSTTTDKISDEDISTAALFAVHASLALGRATLTEAMSTAIETRQVIGQALGILQGRYNIDERAAHAFLWRASSHSNIKVRDIAQRLVDDPSSALPRV